MDENMKIEDTENMKEQSSEELNNSDEKPGKSEIRDLMIYAIQNEDFKELLLSDPDKAMEAFELTDVQIMMVKTLKREDLEQLTLENLNEYFASDSAVYTPDIDSDLTETEEADEEDI